MLYNESVYQKRVCILLVPLLYFFLAVYTLSDYGINWDEPFHFNRGQAYLYYFLTGERNYLNLPAYPELKGSSDFMGREGEDPLYLNSQSSSIKPDPLFRRSYFQSDVFNFEYFIKNDGGGHPPTNGVLSASFNYIFYQKLGVLEDIESYHLFEVVTTTLLILGVSVFTYYNFGMLAAIVASFTLSSYPLFFAESHFNIKDPVQASFFGLTIIAFYFGIIQQRWKLIMTSAVFAGLTLGTKFNALFLPFILIPWLLFYLVTNRLKLTKHHLALFISLLLYPAVAFLIFYIFWPYLWNNSIEKLRSVIDFYIQSGMTSLPEIQRFIYKGFNLFPITWIIITTPIPVLFLASLGLVVSLVKLFRDQKHSYLLIVLWFLLPIIRVSLPGTAIHSGVRHIMEFIPALSILSGIGIGVVYQLKYQATKVLIILILTLSSAFVILELVRLHPNENVYFNQLIGGLSGAREKNIPYWGNSYGNAYLQGVEWLNNNAEENAKVALAIVNMVNVPRTKLRSDIDFSNEHLSGSKMQGEYVLEMTHNWNPSAWYSFAYYDTYLKPVYEVKVDGVPILKIWKNDPKYLINALPEEKEFKFISSNIVDRKLTLDIGSEIFVTQLQIKHDTKACQKQHGGYIRLSVDNKNWVQTSETIDYPQIPVKWLGNSEDTFVYLFVSKKARYLFLDTQMESSCLLTSPEIKILGYQNL